MSRASVMRGLLLFLAGVLVGANAAYFLLVRSQDCNCAGPELAEVASVHTEPAPSSEPASKPAPAPPERVGARPDPATPAADAPRRPAPRPRAIPSDRLLVPVSGVAPEALSDTFDDARGSARVHEAMDIMAPAGTPVLATADGRIEKLFESDNGGLTIYQFDPTGTWCYYYAHLQRYAPGIEEGDTVERGDVIGYVGSTGNANPAAPHLHFGVYLLGEEKRWWKGTPVNPYPLLRPDA